jgi:TATA-box binding protein (TBP) (component of TFIID and TFIIIB)
MSSNSILQNKKDISDENVITNPIKELINIQNLEITNLPRGIRVATMCCSCHLNTNINLHNIEKYMELDVNNVLTIKRNNDNIRTLINLKKPSKRALLNKDKKSNHFYNSVALNIRVTDGFTSDINGEPKINIKFFSNGSLQMSGCKTINDVNIVLNKIINKLKMVKGKLEDGKITEINFVDNRDNMFVNKFKIDMIYCNYSLSVKIDREKLYNLLQKKKIKCIYEPCIRPCVIISFTPSQDNIFSKEVSIFIFEKGNIIITGSRSRNQIMEAYEYINKICLTHINEITKNDDTSDELLLKLYNNVMKDIGNGLVRMN